MTLPSQDDDPTTQYIYWQAANRDAQVDICSVQMAICSARPAHCTLHAADSSPESRLQYQESYLTYLKHQQKLHGFTKTLYF